MAFTFSSLTVVAVEVPVDWKFGTRLRSVLATGIITYVT